MNINMTLESIRENTNTSSTESLHYYVMQRREPWFNKVCSKLLGQQQQAKLKWLLIPSQISSDNLNNVEDEKLVKLTGTKRPGTCIEAYMNLRRLPTYN